MPQVNFRQYPYFPCLQCSESEQIAYINLSEDDKEAILPIFELSQVKYETALADAVAALRDSIGNRPFILDLSKDRAPDAFEPKKKADPDPEKTKKRQAAQDAYNKDISNLLNSADGFGAWRALTAEFPAAIPVLQFTDPEAQGKSILRQAAQLIKGGREQLAIRVTEETSDEILSVIGQIVAILDSAAQLLIIIDCGQGRQRISERAEFAKKAVARIKEEIEPSQSQHLVAVCLNDWYTNPSAFTPKLYESSSWGLWGEASEKFPFLFGDYGAHYRIKKATTYMPGEWKAQVVFPLDEAWIVYRDSNAQDVQGWITGAKIIKKDPHYDGPLDCWGSKLLDRAANNDIDGIALARYWHAAKINMHMHRQIGYALEVMGGEEEP